MLCVCVELKKESGCIGLVVCVECEIFFERVCGREEDDDVIFFLC